MRLTFYFRDGCSLCEAVLEELEPYRRRFGFELEAVDVDGEPELRARYGQIVPVLTGPDGTEICRYFLDPPKLERYLSAA